MKVCEVAQKSIIAGVSAAAVLNSIDYTTLGGGNIVLNIPNIMLIGFLVWTYNTIGILDAEVVLVKGQQLLEITTDDLQFSSILALIKAKIKKPSKLEEPKSDKPAVEEPAVEELAVEEPAEEPAVEEPAVEEPTVEEPKIEEPKLKELKIGGQADKEPMLYQIGALGATQTYSDEISEEIKTKSGTRKSRTAKPIKEADK